jgi:hypothetical protein
VSASAECAVGIHTIRTHGQAFNGIFKQYGSMRIAIQCGVPKRSRAATL